MKELIFMDKNRLEPIGGPIGYLYNLYIELNRIENKDVFWLDDSKQKRHMKIKKIFKKLPKFITKQYYKNKKKNEIENICNKVFNQKEKKIQNYSIENYDLIHFHSTLDMFLEKDLIKNYKGKIAITSHSPEVFHKELIEKIDKQKYLSNKEYYDKLEIIDEYAFNRADYIIFPCKDAEEPYYHTWNKYEEIKKKNNEKYRYIPTGIQDINVRYDKKFIRNKFNIPENAFLISYVGRHNEIKGYDKLKIIGNEIINEYDNVYFLIAGKETPIKGLENNRWIEVGWSDLPNEIINASDLFILPNKETYFDLILLQVLALGKNILLTETGGNKYFKKFNSDGLFYYDYENVNQAIDIIKKLINSNVRSNNKNRKIFEENFTIEKFAKDYINLINSLI